MSFFITQTGFSESLVDTQWVSWQELPEAEKANIAPYCPGGFIARPLQPLSLQANTEQKSFYFDKATLTNEHTINAQGNVKILADGINANAEQAQFNSQTQTGSLQGDVILTLPDVLLGAQSADVDFANNSSQLNNAEFVLAKQDMHGRSKSLSSADNQDYIGKQVVFTRCAPNTLGWQIKASTLKIDDQAQVARIWNPRIEIANVPVLYSPYISFPLNGQARTGLLIPTFGTGFSQEYYLHLAPNYDDTLGLEYKSDYGFLLHNEFRFLTENHNGISDISIGLPSDEQKDAQTDTTPNQRWSVSHQQSGLLTDKVGYDFSTRWVSDSNYDLDITSGKNELIKTQQAKLTLKAQPWQTDSTLSFNYQQPVSDRTEKLQTLDINSSVKKSGHSAAVDYQFQQQFDSAPATAQASDYKLLTVPDLRLTPKTYTLGSGIQLNSQLRYSRFSRQLTSELKNSLTTSQLNLAEETQRNHLALSATRRWQSSLGYLKPSVEFFANHYQYQNELTDENQAAQNQNAWRASLDQGLTLQHSTASARHSFNPRLYYAYSPLTEQPAKVLDTKEVTDFKLFTASRFDGVDRVGDMSRVSTQLAYTITDSTNADRKFKASLTKGAQLSQERLTLTAVDDVEANWQTLYSDWLLDSQYSPNKIWQFSANSAHDHEDLDIKSFAVSSRYQPSERIFADFKLAKADNLDTLSFGAYYPVMQNLALIGFIETEAASDDKLFDWEQQQASQMLVGIDYDNCCWNARFAVLETSAAEDEEGDSLFLDNSNFEVKFELTLKGVGASAGNIEETLNNLDFGYSGKLFNYR